MEHEKYQKLLDQVTEKWMESASQYTNCITDRTVRTVNELETCSRPIRGYPVVIKFRDQEEICTWCDKVCVNRQVLHTYDFDDRNWQHRCQTCGQKINHKQYLKYQKR